MENEKDEKGNGKAPVAKDMVELKHVEVKKQVVSQETLDLMKALKTQALKDDQFVKLTNNEITVLESFMGRRLFLPRIAIIVNQSRIPLGKEGLKKAELESILENLILKGFVISEIVGENRVYYLSEKGKDRVI